MTQRKYSIDEIDVMRNCLGVLSEQTDADTLERQLRTHMMNGTEPTDLVTKAAAKLEASWAVPGQNSGPHAAGVVVGKRVRGIRLGIIDPATLDIGALPKNLHDQVLAIIATRPIIR